MTGWHSPHIKHATTAPSSPQDRHISTYLMWWCQCVMLADAGVTRLDMVVHCCRSVLGGRCAEPLSSALRSEMVHPPPLVLALDAHAL